MVRIGIQRKCSTLKQQREAGELELIIEDFGRAMRQANRNYIAEPSFCQHDSGVRFTPGMQTIWNQYVVFCAEHPE